MTRVKKAKLPRFTDLGDETFEKFGSAASDNIVINLKESRQADGQPIKQNNPKTQRGKRRRSETWRGRVAPLIAEKLRFIQTGKGGSWTWRVGRGFVEIFPSSNELKKLSMWNQRKGYKGWFGLNSTGAKLVKKILRERLEQIVRKASGR